MAEGRGGPGPIVEGGWGQVSSETSILRGIPNSLNKFGQQNVVSEKGQMSES